MRLQLSRYLPPSRAELGRLFAKLCL